ncbi:hypothetical protein Ddc_15673 [Ditylenchus destructor]|nr:hypothetical protein Ddc_15673 [Ditylenchus destructor]
MRSSARSDERQASLENDAHKEPNASKSRLNNKIATMDNGTMVEAFKYLGYCQLAKKSLVSQRFRNVIQTHRQSMPRLYVSQILMERIKPVVKFIEMFNEELSAEAYDEWVVRNQYSKQIPLEGQIAREESSQSDCDFYDLHAYAYYKDPNQYKRTMSARAELNHENWPLFQHFVRLLSDPFVYIEEVDLVLQNDVLNLLAGAFNLERGKLRCKIASVDLYDDFNIQKPINWINKNLSCDTFCIFDFLNSNHDHELLDFFMTGPHCSSTIAVRAYDLSKVVIDFVHREFSTFIVKEEFDEDYDTTTYDFEFNNDDIGKKLQLSVKYYNRSPGNMPHLSLNINEL